jgi:hypothetical protein
MSDAIIFQETLEKLIKNIEVAGSNPTHNGDEAHMLAFVGVCIALDILSQDYYFNKVFRVKNNGMNLKKTIQQEAVRFLSGF